MSRSLALRVWPGEQLKFVSVANVCIHSTPYLRRQVIFSEVNSILQIEHEGCSAAELLRRELFSQLGLGLV
jgi:hypothetical protein